MNEYMVRVNNAVIQCKGPSEYSAMKDLDIFEEIGDLIDFLNPKGGTLNAVWIYQVELNGKKTIAYVTRTA